MEHVCRAMERQIRHGFRGSEALVWRLVPTEERPSELLVTLNGVLVAIMATFSLWAFPRLPDRYPVHFDIHGSPNRWVNASSPEWFLPLGIAVLLNAIWLGFGLGIPKLPVKHINLPNKELFLTLPRERQLAVLRSVSRMLFGSALLMNVLLLGVYGMIFAIAQGWMTGPSLWPIVGLVGAVLVFSVSWTVHLSRMIRRESGVCGSMGTGPSPRDRC